MKITETNCETGETIERDMTPEEQEAYNVVKAEMVANMAAEEAALAAKTAARTSAVAKLQAIGLTEEEALAIIG
jgi:hypothetical protein